jgi:hypothetical protein
MEVYEVNKEQYLDIRRKHGSYIFHRKDDKGYYIKTGNRSIQIYINNLIGK